MLLGKHRVTCQECEHLYLVEAGSTTCPCDTWDGQTKPPCLWVQQPELQFGNQVVFELWQQLHLTGRQIGFGLGPIRTEAAIALVQAYAEPLSTLERVLLFEQLIYPEIAKDGFPNRD